MYQSVQTRTNQPLRTSAYDLPDRLIGFAASIGAIVKKLPNDRIGTHVGNQLIRSGTAPFAHHAEAQGAESRRDFVHKLRLGVKELRETLAWLHFCRQIELAPKSPLEEVSNECTELIKIIASSIRTASRKEPR